VMQPQYNLVARGSYEGPMQELCTAQEIAVLPFYGLASGFLTGKYRAERDWHGSPRESALKAAAASGGWGILAAMDAVAAETGATHAQIALAWLNSRDGVAAPLASATSPAQLADLIAGANLQLGPDHIARLESAQTT
jgi:aryl-alcohol dehydrogenase-like predicted oxidoreductase